MARSFSSKALPDTSTDEVSGQQIVSATHRPPLVVPRPICCLFSGPGKLDRTIAVVSASTLIAYVFYTISRETEQTFDARSLGLTIPLPPHGIFRYLSLIHQRAGGGSPADLLI